MKISSKYIKEKALEIGFSACGIAKADFLKEEHEHLINWLNEKKQGTISYLEKNTEQKTDPRKILPEVKSVIGVIANYYPEEKQNPDSFYKITKYAYPRDYHVVLKEKISKLIDEIKIIEPDALFQFFVDGNHLLEKTWAIECGLGWRGKNSLLVNKNFGSFVLIGIILTSIELETDVKQKDFCGTCTKCIDTCPVTAIEKPFELSASKCIANFTIEQRKDASTKNTFGWIYGCDICQDVCPWNKNIPFAQLNEFKPNPELLKMTKSDWENLNEENFNFLFNDSAIKRIGFEKIKRNIKGNSSK